MSHDDQCPNCVDGFTVSAGDPFDTAKIVEERKSQRNRYFPDSKISYAEEFTRDDGSTFLVIYHRRVEEKHGYTDLHNWV